MTYLTVEQIKDRIERAIGNNPATAPIEELIEYFSDPSWRTEESFSFGLSVLIDLEAFGSADGVEYFYKEAMKGFKLA